MRTRWEATGTGRRLIRTGRRLIRTRWEATGTSLQIDKCLLRIELSIPNCLLACFFVLFMVIPSPLGASRRTRVLERDYRINRLRGFGSISSSCNRVIVAIPPLAAWGGGEDLASGSLPVFDFRHSSVVVCHLLTSTLSAPPQKLGAERIFFPAVAVSLLFPRPGWGGRFVAHRVSGGTTAASGQAPLGAIESPRA
jgi:hypothetical protein